MIRKTYQRLINKLDNFTLEKTPDYSFNNNWMNVVKFKRSNKLNTENLVKYFYKHKIQVRPIWFLNHKQKPYKAYEKYKITNAKKIIDSCLCLPSSSNLKILEIKKICKLLENF
jgi:perosamine synthetase